MDHETLKQRTLQQQEERKAAYTVHFADNEVEIDRLTLLLVDNFKSAFDPQKLAVRYAPILAQYDYIVGDISADQLRLKGFYADDQHVAQEYKISTLQDYLYEFVNFGAPYFVLENINPRRNTVAKKPTTPRRRKPTHKKSDNARKHQFKINQKK